MRMKSIFMLLLLCYIIYAEKQMVDTYILLPIITQHDLLGNFNDYEIERATLQLAKNINIKYGSQNVKFVYNDSAIINTRAKIIKFNLKHYEKIPAKLNQWEGYIIIEVVIFNNKNDKNPQSYIFEAVGKRHWGDSIPFENAINALCEKINRPKQTGSAVILILCSLIGTYILIHSFLPE